MTQRYHVPVALDPYEVAMFRGDPWWWFGFVHDLLQEAARAHGWKGCTYELRGRAEGLNGFTWMAFEVWPVG